MCEWVSVVTTKTSIRLKFFGLNKWRGAADLWFESHDWTKVVRWAGTHIIDFHKLVGLYGAWCSLSWTIEQKWTTTTKLLRLFVSCHTFLSSSSFVGCHQRLRKFPHLNQVARRMMSNVGHERIHIGTCQHVSTGTIRTNCCKLVSHWSEALIQNTWCSSTMLTHTKFYTQTHVATRFNRIDIVLEHHQPSRGGT